MLFCHFSLFTFQSHLCLLVQQRFTSGTSSKTDMPSQNLLRGGVFPLGAALACLVHNRQQLNYSLEAPKADKISKSMCTFPANNPTEDRSIYHENRTLNTRIFGVFDGHGGWNVSNFLENNMTNVLLKNLKMMECIKNDNDFSHEAHDVIIEAAMLKSFTELEESYIEKIRSAYELGFGGNRPVFLPQSPLY